MNSSQACAALLNIRECFEGRDGCTTAISKHKHTLRLPFDCKARLTNLADGVYHGTESYFKLQCDVHLSAEDDAAPYSIPLSVSFALD